MAKRIKVDLYDYSAYGHTIHYSHDVTAKYKSTVLPEVLNAYFGPNGLFSMYLGVVTKTRNLNSVVTRTNATKPKHLEHQVVIMLGGPFEEIGGIDETVGGGNQKVGSDNQ